MFDFDPFFQWNMTLWYSKHSSPIVRGLKNAFLMPKTPLLYHYLTVLWQSSRSSKEELGILLVELKWPKVHQKKSQQTDHKGGDAYGQSDHKMFIFL